MKKRARPFNRRTGPDERILVLDDSPGKSDDFPPYAQLMNVVSGISAKIHSLRDEDAIARTVTRELARNSRYKSVFLRLTDNGACFRIASVSFSSKILKGLEKRIGATVESVRVEVAKTKCYRMVLMNGKTIIAPSSVFVREAFSRPWADIISAALRMGKKVSIMTPLFGQGRIIGCISMSAPEIPGDMGPAFMNLARHVSVALEMAEEHARRMRAEQRALDILESMGEGVSIHELDGRILQVNRQFEQMLGRKREDLIGKNPLEAGLMNSEQVDLVRTDILPRLMSEGTVHDTEMLSPLPDGTLAHGSITWSLVRDEQGRPTAIINVVKNITRQKAAEASLKDFSRKMISIREEEKKKLASNLHDELGDMAVSLTASLSLADEELLKGSAGTARKKIRESRLLLLQYVEKLKKIATDLRPPQLDILGLPGALQDYFAGVEKLHKLTVRFTDDTDRVKIPEETAIALYRVAQEAMSNVLRHANATTVRASLTLRDNNILLSVYDNGKGLMPDPRASKPGAIGITGMRERMESMGGSFSVSSTPGQGTVVLAGVPFHRRSTP